jgi:phospholipid-transporting ATPase
LRFGARQTAQTPTTGKEFKRNVISSTKYTIIGFLPKALLEQFRRAANLFFLLVGLLPLVKGVSNIRPEAAMAPILIVLSLSMIREAVEDLRRAASDRRINARPCSVLLANNARVSVPWRQLAVGDLIELKADESVPADIVILQSALPSALAYVETSSLDGEANLKIHEAPKALPDAIPATPAGALAGSVRCELPNNRLYRFEGSLRLDGHADEISVSHSNVILRGCVLRNTPHVIGVVVYTGKETKLVKNSVAPPSKRSALERKIDVAIAVIFALDMLVCVTAAVLSQLSPNHEHDYVHDGVPSLASSGTLLGGLFTFISFLVLFNQLIPLSLYVSLELSKIFQALFMQEDLNMYYAAKDTPAKSNNTSLTEELGQIEMIMSDKTGTLTQNSMVFQCLAVARRAYDLRLDADADLCRSRRSLDADLADGSTAHGQQLRRFWLALALCHTVIVESDVAAVDDDGAPTAPPPGESAPVKYQASSPDELALVLAARDRGFELRQRKTNSVVVRIDGRDEEFVVLAINEFDSTRKRMSALIRFPDHSVYGQRRRRARRGL